MMDKKCFTSAFKKSIPIFFGYIAIGVAFGLMVVEANYPWWLSPIMSITMFAGAGEYIAIGLFATGTPLFAILITEFLVNIRHIVYGLSLITKFNKCGKWKFYMIFGLTDETYSLLASTDVPEDMSPGNFYGLIALFDHFYWILGSLIGAVLGKIIPFDFKGVDFALTSLFAVLMLDQLQKTKDIVPIIIGALTTVISVLLFRFGFLNTSNNVLLISLSLGLGVLLLVKNQKNLKTKQKQELQ